MAIKDLSPGEIQTILTSGNPPVLIDVREQWEYDIVHLQNARLMPLSTFMQHFPELVPDKSYLIYCHHGVRSMQVCNYLQRMGFTDLINLQGGIEAYALEVDTTLARY